MRYGAGSSGSSWGSWEPSWRTLSGAGPIPRPSLRSCLLRPLRASRTIWMLVVAALVLNASPRPCAAQPHAAVDSLIAAADGDTVLVLVEYIERLEADLSLERIAREYETGYLRQQVEELRPRWWKELISDPRLWFILGAAAGISVAE